MWPFSRRRDATIPDALGEAIEFASQRWIEFSRRSGIPDNVHLRDRMAYFAPDCRTALIARFPILTRASEEVLLLTMLQGIERSGLETRRMIELQLGVVLPNQS